MKSRDTAIFGVVGGGEQFGDSEKCGLFVALPVFFLLLLDACCKDSGKFPTFCLFSKRLVGKDLIGCHNALWRWSTFSRDILDLQESRSNGRVIVGVAQVSIQKV